MTMQASPPTQAQRAALDAEGRRIRERDAYEAGWRETLAKVDEAAGMLTPMPRSRPCPAHPGVRSNSTMVSEPWNG